MQFLVALRNTTRSHGGYTTKETHYFNLSNIEHFVPVQQISERIEKYRPEDLSEEERELVKLFKEATQRRAEGKPDRTWDRFDDD
jgi:hypothetical protein